MIRHKFDVYELIDLIRAKPGMYLGCCSLTRLRAFIDGYKFAANQCDGEVIEHPSLFDFHDWVTRRFGLKESTPGWCELILAECERNEARAFNRFIELTDEYRRDQL